MNVLIVNSFYYYRGGDATYMFNLADLLKINRHNVLFFCMHHPQNLPNQYSEFFVPEIDLLDCLQKASIGASLKVIERSIYSTQSKKNLSKLIDHYPVDIAHIQSIHGHISPSIFHLLKKRGIPIIWTLHDYFLLCPNSTFLSGRVICESCRGNKFYNVLLKKCRKNSYSASGIVMIEEYIHRIIGLLNLVDYYITPSRFMYNKIIEYGFPADKIIYIPNFIDSAAMEEKTIDNYAVYAGRISYEKGLVKLLKVWTRIKGARLLIAGDGPLRQKLESEYGAYSDHIIFLGHINNKEKIKQLLNNARFLIQPSEWYENAPYSILESFSVGTPVVGSAIGGIPELVINGVTGLLSRPGDQSDLAEKVIWMLEHKSECAEMGRRAQEHIKKYYTPDIHYNKIMSLYSSVLKRKN